MEMTQEQYCMLLGQKDVLIYERNKVIAALTAQVGQLKKEIADLRNPPDADPAPDPAL